MRAASTRPGPVRRGEHACCVVAGAGEFRDAALVHLGDGLARGDRVVYVAGRSWGELVADLEPLGDVERLLSEGTLVVESTEGLYAPDGFFDAGAQVDRYRQRTEAALAAGYRGLCVAADATALVSSEASRRRFMAYELAVGRLMTEAPMSALCAYDITVLGPAAGELRAVHPAGAVPADVEPGFQLCFDADGLRLSGEVDLANHLLFGFALEAAVGCADDPVVIDVSGLDFIDVRGLVTLGSAARALRARSGGLVLVDASALVRRCAALLDLDFGFFDRSRAAS